MMKISRENYEIWFIDYLDGKLDSKARTALDDFLQANPDLEKELKGFEEVKLSSAVPQYSSTASLYKNESDLMAVSRPDYLLIKQMEQGLSGEEESELSEEIRCDGSLIKRGLEFQQTKLLAEAIPYFKKGALLQRSVVFRYMTARVAAAVIVVAVFLTVWNSDSFFSFQKQEVALQKLSSRPAIFEEQDFSVPEPVQMVEGRMGQDKYIHQQSEVISSEIDNNQEFSPEMKGKEVPMERMISNVLKEGLAVQVPNAYEAGLRHMMPMYLDINRNSEPMFAKQSSQSDSPSEGNFLMKGIQFVDRVSGDLVNFDKLYDEDGNFVAYNFKAGYLEVERKLRR
ncbi:hypothetical protein [Marinilabilia salmonicolor]|uniref:hypothetical protein n=1 Tax=Marinilabilia salmonicolor TaxID=989 RepID=UPI000299DC90|nr:hypothetical protein [Marinilabilia salmonicolor]